MLGKTEKLFLIVLVCAVVGYVAVFIATIGQNSAPADVKAQSSVIAPETPENALQTRIDIYRHYTIVYSDDQIVQLYVDLSRYPVLSKLCDYVVTDDNGHNCLLESVDKMQSTLQYLRQ